MWRKIHSNRDPRDTLYSELRKEFKPWFTGAKTLFAKVLSVYPRFSFSLMILCLTLSGILSFTIFRNRDKAIIATTSNKPNVMQEGFSTIIRATGQLRETIALKAVIDSLTAKKGLTGSDSLLLDSTLSRLQKINPPLK
ncbi:hypothetical protein IDJ75_11265 [Mucilaginibacter rigui]|uniref:Uncharacterized protein n=1 Tax=Mucilaginibacter rigui TaxID=534635 RepID=A0ABR7X8C8_9SPHI|nr:hypothetical protein [Mucilaginibacter rigui]MBD1385860.1 hypothetical protein [Mucilaginibacter rigui]